MRASSQRNPIVLWCDVCGAAVEWLHIDEVAELLQVSRRTVYYWIARLRVHTHEIPSGRTLICRRSL